MFDIEAPALLKLQFGKPEITMQNEDLLRKSLEFERFRSHILELLVTGQALPRILEEIVREMERINPGMLCSILILDEDGRRLHNGAAPSLPDFYNKAIDGLEIGPGVGSCGTAVYTKERVVVEDISTHPFWAPYAGLAARSGLGSCWSQPVFSTSGGVLGTFGIYHREAHSPIESDLAAIERCAQLTSLAIERGKEMEKLRVLSAAIAQSPVTTVITDTVGRIKYVNRKFSSTTGYSAEEALHKNPRMLKSGDKPASAYKELWDTILSGSDWRGIFHNKRKDGELYWESAVVFPVKDEAGTITDFIALKQDITERVLLDERLLLQAQAMDSSSGYIVIVDALAADLPAIYVNAAFERVTGYSAREAIGRNVRFLQGCERDQPCLAELREGLRSLSGCHALLRNYRKDGSAYWNDLTISPVRDRNGKTTHFIGISNDVTELVTMQDKLIENENRLRIAQDYANIGSWDWDLASGTVFWSERIWSLLGRIVGDPVPSRKAYFDAVHPGDRTALFEAMSVSYEKGHPFETEYRCLWPDGSLHWLHESGNTTLDEQGVPQHVLGLVRDVTDRKQAERELIDSREEANRANSAKSEFLSSMSHELRTPMNAILGFGQLLESDAGLDDSQRDQVHEINTAGRHLLELINEVLDLSRIEAGRVELDSEPLVCADLVDECIRLIDPLASRRGITFEFDADRALAVYADRVAMKQVLVNLLSNAVKYNRPQGRIMLALSSEGDMVEFSVSDTGNGISESRMRNLFQPFNRLGQENGEVEGTGIGLTISKRLVELMGGSIGAESEPGQGSRFWLRLPNASSNEPLLLHIEDNPANLRLVGQILGMRDQVRLISAQSLALGMEMAESRRPDLILVDLDMPGMDGHEILERLRASSLGSAIPVIAIAASAMPSDIEQGMAEGFADYLAKPLSIPKFLAAVEAQLTRTKLGA